MKRVLVLGTVILVGGLSAVVSSEQEPSQAALDAHGHRAGQGQPVRHHRPRARSTGRRSAAATRASTSAKGGITLVDTKLPGWGQALMDRIRTVSDKR